MSSKVIQTLIYILLFSPAFAFANHGPGTSGGGTSTISGETISCGEFVFSLSETYTDYENVSEEEAKERAVQSGEFDSLRDAFITTGTLSIGLTEDLQLDSQIGWYSGRDFIDAHATHEEEHERSRNSRHSEEIAAEAATANPEGLTDLYMRAKYRVLKGSPGNLAILGGVIIPTGKDDVRLSDGEKLEPSSQPGGGSFGYQAGLAYSRFLTPQSSIDLSSIYTFRAMHDGFEIGDRVDSGIALSYRLAEDIQKFPQVSLFTEINHVWIGKDYESEEKYNPNSGGDIIYASPGVRLRMSEGSSIALSPSWPIYQDLNGDQLETDFRLNAQLTIDL